MDNTRKKTVSGKYNSSSYGAASPELAAAGSKKVYLRFSSDQIK